MFDPNTIKGLDGAIEDLHKAVEALPDGPLKKKLNQRLERMRSIRDHMETPKAFRKAHPFIYFTIFTIILLAVLLAIRCLHVSRRHASHV